MLSSTIGVHHVFLNPRAGISKELREFGFRSFSPREKNHRFLRSVDLIQNPSCQALRGEPVRQDMDRPPSRPKHVRRLGSHRGYRQLRRGRGNLIDYDLGSQRTRHRQNGCFANLFLSSAMTAAPNRSRTIGAWQHQPLACRQAVRFPLSPGECSTHELHEGAGVSPVQRSRSLTTSPTTITPGARNVRSVGPVPPKCIDRRAANRESQTRSPPQELQVGCLPQEVQPRSLAFRIPINTTSVLP